MSIFYAESVFGAKKWGAKDCLTWKRGIKSLKEQSDDIHVEYYTCIEFLSSGRRGCSKCDSEMTSSLGVRVAAFIHRLNIHESAF